MYKKVIAIRFGGFKNFFLGKIRACPRRLLCYQTCIFDIYYIDIFKIIHAIE